MWPATAVKDFKPDTSLQEEGIHMLESSPAFSSMNEDRYLKDYTLEIKFKTEASPVFCKPHFVPFAIQDGLVL